MALQSNLFSETVLAILAAHVDPANIPDSNGVLPHQKTIEAQLSEEVCDAVLAANTDVAKANDDSGAPSLHKAIDSTFTDEVILVLLAAYPEYAKVKDEEELLPLHKAMKKQMQPRAQTKVVNYCFIRQSVRSFLIPLILPYLRPKRKYARFRITWVIFHFIT